MGKWHFRGRETSIIIIITAMTFKNDKHSTVLCTTRLSHYVKVGLLMRIVGLT